MSTSTIIMALLMGFTGSLHCAGMCGPIIFIMPFQAFSGMRRILALLAYHFSRISVYAGMAVVLHSFRDLFNPQVQQYISITLGVTLLVAGILSFFSGHIKTFKLPWSGLVQRQLGKLMQSPGFGSIAASGFMNGLLPCGLVYMALSASLSMSSALNAAIMVAFFGIGTMPMLISITLLKSRLRFLSAGTFRRLVPVMVFVFGCLFVLRGLNLNIPYLSPKVEMTPTGVHSCCHKK
jgi:hypothetical protein